MAKSGRNETVEVIGRELTEEERRELEGKWVNGWRCGPTTTSVEVTDERGNTWIVTTELAVIGGRMEPSVVTVRSQGEPITRETMKSIPFGGIFTETRTVDRRGMEWLAEQWSDPRVRADHRKENAALFGSRRGRTLDDETLAVVASAYREAFAKGESVVRAVAAACHISESTAGKRIRAAKNAGLLEEVSR